MMTIKRTLIASIALFALGSAFAAAVMHSELETKTALLDKQVIQLANKQLEVEGLTSEVMHLNDQAQALADEQLLVADLNSEHQQSETQIKEQHLAVMINSNELKVSDHDPTRAWANATVPDAAGRLLYQASGSPHYHSNKDSDGATSRKLSAIGLRTAAL